MNTRPFLPLLLLGALLAGSAAADNDGPAQAQYSPTEAQYLLRLQQVVAANVQTPDRPSPRTALEGTAVVHVEIARDGTILGATLAQRSGSRLMDNEALDVFARMHRLPPIPTALYPEKEKATFEVPIGYSYDN